MNRVRSYNFFFLSNESHGDGIRQAALIVVDSHICLAVLDFTCPLSCLSLTHSVSLKTYSILVLFSIFSIMVLLGLPAQVL